MADVTISPNMNLPVPVPGVAPGPAWANYVVADMNAIDSHDHTTGKGVPITPDGLNINADLPFNENNATTVRTVRFTPQDAVLADAADVGCIYEVEDDLYYNDGAGNQVRITQAGSVTGSSGTITGLPSGTASASYSAGTFTFESATSVPATMAIGPIVTGAAIASPFTVTLAASAAQAASYGLTWPLESPTANQVMVSDGSGNLSWTRGLLPLGSVIATFPNLSGAYSTASTTTADANGFVKCNGQTISDVTSPMNGAVVPNINNSVFLAGNTTAGSTGGSATSSALLAHTHAGGNFASSLGISGGTASLTGTTTFATSTHNHNIAHVHIWGFEDYLFDDYSNIHCLTDVNTAATSLSAGNPEIMSSEGFTSGSRKSWGQGDVVSDRSYYTTGVISPASGSGTTAASGAPSATASVGISSTAASLTGSNLVTGTSTSTGSGSSFSILPPYITAVYLMRIK